MEKQSEELSSPPPDSAKASNDGTEEQAGGSGQAMNETIDSVTSSSLQAQEEGRGGQVMNGVAPRTERRSVRTEKDPLNIGVPFPVIVRELLPPVSSVARMPPTSLFGAAEESDYVGDTNNRDKSLFRRGNTAVGIPVTSAVDGDQYEISAHVDAQWDRLDASIKRMANGTTGEELYDESIAMRLSLQERIPGGYAIGGPGLQADDGNDVEEAAATASVPSASDAVVLDGITHSRRQDSPVERSLSICVSTTGEGETVSSYYNSANLDRSTDILVEATLVLDQQEDNTDVVHAEAKPLYRIHRPRSLLLGFALLFVATVVLTVAVLARQRPGDSSDAKAGTASHVEGPPMGPTLPTLRILQRIEEAGVVRCGRVAEVSNFLVQVATSNQENGQSHSTDEVDFKDAHNFTDNIVSKRSRQFDSRILWIGLFGRLLIQTAHAASFHS